MAKGLRIIETIARIVDRLRSRKSITCAELLIDRTALDELEKLPKVAIQHEKQKVANA